MCEWCRHNKSLNQSIIFCARMCLFCNFKQSINFGPISFLFLNETLMLMYAHDNRTITSNFSEKIKQTSTAGFLSFSTDIHLLVDSWSILVKVVSHGRFVCDSLFFLSTCKSNCFQYLSFWRDVDDVALNVFVFLCKKLRSIRWLYREFKVVMNFLTPYINFVVIQPILHKGTL